MSQDATAEQTRWGSHTAHQSEPGRGAGALAGVEAGDDAHVEVQIAVDRPFVPANVSPGSEDTRELGIRVYRAAVERLPNVYSLI